MQEEIPRTPAWSWPEGDVPPGGHQDISILAGQGVADYEIGIPVHIWRGMQAGPSVFVTGALHGDEINGTGAIRELILNPGFELIAGTLVLVPVLNIPGFERHSRYLPDRRDLNRCFPGNVSGSTAKRLAHVIFKEIIGRCDYGIDLHSAAMRRTNFPNVRGDLSDPKIRRLALAFGSELVVDNLGPKGSMRREASLNGCPTILLEAGEVWKVEPTIVEIAMRGVRNVLQDLGMVEGLPEKPAFRIVARNTSWIRAESGGFLRFHAAPGDLVEKDQILATNTSLLGQEQSTIVSPMDGVILGMTTLPSVAPGDPVCHVARLRQPMERLERTVNALDEDTLHERLRADLGSSVRVEETEETEGTEEIGGASAAADLAQRLVVGWREMLELPEWGIQRIKTKVDTGARTSALHVNNLTYTDDGKVLFDVVVREHPLRLVAVEAALVRMSRVKPTHDRVEERPVVKTTMRLGGMEHSIEIALVARPGMSCRMLLGRRALAHHFLVNSTQCFLVSGRKHAENTK